MSRKELAILLKDGLNKVIGSAVYAMNPSITAFDGLIDAIRKTAAAPFASRGALKVLLPIDDAVNATTALDRMTTELDVMGSPRRTRAPRGFGRCYFKYLPNVP